MSTRDNVTEEIVSTEIVNGAGEPGAEQLKPPLTPSSWEALCAWLTRSLRGMTTTIERKDRNGERVVECLESPLENLTTHQTPNGVQVISINIRTNGASRLFEISGPNSIDLARNAAGWPTSVEVGYQDGRVVLLFSGHPDLPKGSSSNAWGE